MAATFFQGGKIADSPAWLTVLLSEKHLIAPFAADLVRVPVYAHK